MYQKLKQSLVAFLVAASFIAGSALVGQPLSAEPAPPAPVSPAAVGHDGADKGAAELSLLKARATGLSMPYYAFGSLLPRARSS